MIIIIDFITFIDHQTFQSKSKEIDVFRKLRFQPRSVIDGYFVEVSRCANLLMCQRFAAAIINVL